MSGILFFIFASCEPLSSIQILHGQRGNRAIFFPEVLATGLSPRSRRLRARPTLNPSLLQRSSTSLFLHEIHYGYSSQKILNSLTGFLFKLLVFFIFLKDKGLQSGCSINEYGGCHFIVIPFSSRTTHEPEAHSRKITCD